MGVSGLSSPSHVFLVYKQITGVRCFVFTTEPFLILLRNEKEGAYLPYLTITLPTLCMYFLLISLLSFLIAGLFFFSIQNLLSHTIAYL